MFAFFHEVRSDHFHFSISTMYALSNIMMPALYLDAIALENATIWTTYCTAKKIAVQRIHFQREKVQINKSKLYPLLDVMQN